MEGTPNERSRAQAVFIRHEDEVGAMAWNQRVKTRVKNIFTPARTAEDVAQASQDEEMDHKKTVQYRLEATKHQPKQSILMRIITLNGLLGSSSSGGAAVGVNPNQRLAMYLHWMFRVNFLFLFVVMCVAFFAWVIFFAGWITLAGRMDEQCVRIGGDNFAAQDAPFADAFALSWTTFSTVGYGSTYPALAHENDSPTNCFFINFICSLESLIGVLYSGFCGAILFGKVLRIQSHAQVIFSDPIIIRYGQGALNEDADPDDLDENEGTSPFPILEFRIVNKLFNEVGGEIMDATLNVVANIDANDADPAVRDNDGSDHGGRFSTTSQTSGGDTYSDTGSNAESMRSHDNAMSNLTRKFLDPLKSSLAHHRTTVEEDPSARLVGKHIFSKMVIEAYDHPFFKRVWVARHILDDQSPLLKHRVRRQIRRNGGTWPEKLNSASAIRDSLQFNQILVSLNGVSNVSASDVYAQKIYDFVDINIGYQFVNILYRDTDKTLGVDIDLINDVREQNGGGGEPLILEE